MITAVDSSVLLDIFTDSPAFRAGSAAAITAARRLGALIACPVVWAEVAAAFPEAATMVAAMAAVGARFDPFDEPCAALAGASWRRYRLAGGPRERLVADFFVAAHAQVRGGRLLSRDRGFYRHYFPQLEVIS